MLLAQAFVEEFQNFFSGQSLKRILIYLVSFFIVNRRAPNNEHLRMFNHACRIDLDFSFLEAYVINMLLTSSSSSWFLFELSSFRLFSFNGRKLRMDERIDLSMSDLDLVPLIVQVSIFLLVSLHLVAIIEACRFLNYVEKL